MKPAKKAKWIIGATGVTFSAFILSQMDTVQSNTDPVQPEIVIDESISERENELLARDWVNFETKTVEIYKPDRVTRRS